jgi:hypothetical protein
MIEDFVIGTYLLQHKICMLPKATSFRNHGTLTSDEHSAISATSRKEGKKQRKGLEGGNIEQPSIQPLRMIFKFGYPPFYQSQSVCAVGVRL